MHNNYYPQNILLAAQQAIDLYERHQLWQVGTLRVEAAKRNLYLGRIIEISETTQG